MSIAEDLITYFNDSDDAALVAFRNALGANKMWLDILPENVSVPYCAVAQTGTRLFNARKSTPRPKRIEDVLLQIRVWSTKRGTAEDLIELADNAFIYAELGMGVYFENRYVGWDGEEKLYMGVLEMYIRQERD